MNYNYDYACTVVNDDVIYNCKMSYVFGWWLRSPDLHNDGGAYYVYTDGYVGHYSYVSRDSCGRSSPDIISSGYDAFCVNSDGNVGYNDSNVFLDSYGFTLRSQIFYHIAHFTYKHLDL